MLGGAPESGRRAPVDPGVAASRNRGRELPGRSGEEPTLVELMADHYRHAPRARWYVVHRIDRDTSGLVLFARTPAAQEEQHVANVLATGLRLQEP